MGHITSKSYSQLQQRLNSFPQGLPASETAFKILELLFTEEEADLINTLHSTSMVTVKNAAKAWNKSLDETQKIMDGLAVKGLMVYVLEKDAYTLFPPMAGFFEFSLMRLDGKFDKQILSELYHQYINIESGFIKQLIDLNPAISRIFVHEDQIDCEKSVILDYERASHIIDTATCITVGNCFCRHKMHHLGKACDNPVEVCLSFNYVAGSLSKYGIAKEIDKEEAHRILKECIDLGLVQIGDNVQKNVNWICNCCSCCCEAFVAYKRFDIQEPKFTSNFYARVNQEECNGCGICSKKCPIEIPVINKQTNASISKIDSNRCIGCGVCSRFCSTQSITMMRKIKTNVPATTLERVILEAINEGKLQNILFYNKKKLNRFFEKLFSMSLIKLLLFNKPVIWCARKLIWIIKN